MEKVFYIDLLNVKSKEELHAAIADSLPLPDYYGRNLDAFADVLSEYGRDWNIIFYNAQNASEQLGGYYQALLRLCENAVRSCSVYKIRFFD